MNSLSRLIIALAVVLWCLAFFATALSQTTQPTPDDEPIKVRTVLLNVPVIVSDRNGLAIPKLTKDDFTVISNGQKQRIEFFSDAEVPMTVAIAIDTSGSTRNALGVINHAASQFLKTLAPNDRGMILTFDDNINVLQKLTTDKKDLRDGILAAESGVGRIIMNDALIKIVNTEFAGIKGRKAIIVLTDAGEFNPETWDKLKDALIESDTIVYPVYFQTFRVLPMNVKTITYDELVKVFPINYLYSIANATGGRLLVANGSDFLQEFQTIADELKKMYIVGFYPETYDDGKRNEVSISVNRTDAVLRLRRTIRVGAPRLLERKKNQ